jgi:hypothetical protein
MIDEESEIDVLGIEPVCVDLRVADDFNLPRRLVGVRLKRITLSVADIIGRGPAR